MNGEIANLYIAGMSLVALVLLILVLYGRMNDSRSLTKIRVRIDERDRRPLPPEEQGVAATQDVLIVLLFVLGVLAGMIALFGKG